MMWWFICWAIALVIAGGAYGAICLRERVRMVRDYYPAHMVTLGVAVVWLTVSFCVLVAQAECRSYGRQLESSTSWDVWAGCFVQTESGVFHVDQVRQATIDE